MFTARELELIRVLVERSMCNKEAATVMGISLKTVETHRGNVMRKLREVLCPDDIFGLNKVDLALYAVVNELVDMRAIQRKYQAEIPSPS